MNTKPQLAESHHSDDPASVSDPERIDGGSSINQVIASLTKQLQRENETIVQLMERQRTLRKQLLQAQERSLSALRRSRDESAETR